MAGSAGRTLTYCYEPQPFWGLNRFLQLSATRWQKGNNGGGKGNAQWFGPHSYFVYAILFQNANHNENKWCQLQN